MKFVKTALKFSAGLLLVIIVACSAFAVKSYYAVEARMARHYNVSPEKISLSLDSASIAEGRRLASTNGCRDCHGADMGGKVFIDDPALGRLSAPNLTIKSGRFGTDYWVLALKHGLKADKTPLLIMPSHKYALLSEHDMSLIISYCSQVPRVNRTLPENNIRPLTHVLTELQEIELIPAEKIDHDKPLVIDVVPEVSRDYGQYIANG